MGTPSSARIIQNIDTALKVLVIFYCANGTAVEEMADRNEHRRKEVGEGESISWGVARTKCKGCECKITKNMFFHKYLWQLCLEKKTEDN